VRTTYIRPARLEVAKNMGRNRVGSSVQWQKQEVFHSSRGNNKLKTDDDTVEEGEDNGQSRIIGGPAKKEFKKIKTARQTWSENNYTGSNLEVPVKQTWRDRRRRHRKKGAVHVYKTEISARW